MVDFDFCPYFENGEGWMHGSMTGTWWWAWPLLWLAIGLVIGFLVYKDAEKRGMNGLLWFILVLLPMVGLLFLLIYIVMREEIKTPSNRSQGKKPRSHTR